MKTIVLVGMPGAGKSTVGKELEKICQCTLSDVDSLIEEEQKKSIAQIFSLKGESFFRQLEENKIKQIFKPENQIISLGGGAFENENIRKFLLENSNVIYLKTSAKIIFNRVSHQNDRPLLNNNMTLEKIKDIFSKREKNYKLAHFEILTDNKSPEKIAKEIIECLN